MLNKKKKLKFRYLQEVTSCLNSLADCDFKKRGNKILLIDQRPNNTLHTDSFLTIFSRLAP